MNNRKSSRMRVLATVILLFIFNFSFADISAPPGFSIQTLNLTNGQALKPDGWFYSEQHRSQSSLRWVISKEDAREADGAYDVGISINLMLGFSEKTGMSSEQLSQSLISQITSYGEIIAQCEPQFVGGMKRVCVEKFEINKLGKKYHVMYTFMWWPNKEFVAYTSAGSPPELWEKYQSTFNTMNEIEVIGVLDQD